MFFSFNPFITYEVQCSKARCGLGENGSVKIVDVTETALKNRFVTNTIEHIFRNGLKYNTYKLEIQDLSELSRPDAIDLILLANVSGIERTTKYNKKNN